MLLTLDYRRGGAFVGVRRDTSPPRLHHLYDSGALPEEEGFHQKSWKQT